MKRKLLLMLSMIIFVGGIQTAKAAAADYLSGWTEVTSLPTSSEELANYYYVFVATEADLMVAQEKNVEQEDLLTLVYRYPMNPYTWKRVVWMIDYSEDYLYGIRNLNNSTHFMQSRGNWPWRVQFNWETDQSQWTQWQFAYSGGSWTIQNKLSSDNGGGDNFYLGAWKEKQWKNGEVLAGNKDGDNVGHYKIYQILRTEYNAKAKQYATNVTSKITNPSFDDGDAFAQKKANAVGTSITGWTIAEGGNYQYYTVGKSRSSDPDNDSGFGKTITAANGTKYVHIRHGWQNSTTAISQTLSNLPVGEYTLTIDHKGATPRSKSPKLTVKATPATGSVGGVKYSSYPTGKTRDNTAYTFEDNYGDWSTISYTFFVTEAGDVVLYIGCTDSDVMNSSNDEVIFDNVNLTYKNYTATLQSALDRATLLYARTEDSDLNSAIAAAQAVLDNVDNTVSYQSTINSAVTTLRTAIDTAYEKVTFASGENITFLLENASFESSEALLSNVTTSINDVTPDINYASMQPLEGWIINSTEANIASGVFEYNSVRGINGYPTTGISTPTVGNSKVLGMIAGWGARVQYKQSVTLPAGRYTVNVPVYNKNGATAFTKNLIGFVENGGTEHLATTTAYTVGAWTTSTIEFDLNAETSGYMSVGYQSVSGQGSGNMPRLYVDGFTITFTDAANVYAQTRTAATTTYNDATYANVTGSEKTALYNAINPDPAPSTVSEYFAAVVTINNAVEAFTAAKSSYDAFEAAKAVEYADNQPYASAAKYAAIATAQAATATSASDADTKTAAIIAAYRAYIESNAMAEGVVGAVDYTSAVSAANAGTNTGWTNGIETNSGEGYTEADGNVASSYLDGGWSNSAGANIDMTRSVEIPAGKYLLTVTARGASSLDTYTLSIGGETVNLPKNSSTGGVFNKGWDDVSVEFEADGTTQTLEVIANSTAYYQWISINRFRLVKIANFKNVSEAGYATYVTPTAVTFEANEAYVVTSQSGDYVTLEAITEAPANTPVIIKGAGGHTISFAASASKPATNLLKVSDGSVTYTEGYYVLAKPAEEVGFYTFDETLPEGQVYLDVTGVSGAKARFLSFSFDDASGISVVNADSKDDGILYNLAGQRVSNPAKGIYIKNGKKVFVK